MGHFGKQTAAHAYRLPPPHHTTTASPPPPIIKSVVLRGYHVRVLTAHNAEVYFRAGLEAMAHTWRMLGIMLSGVPGGLQLPLGAREPDFDLAGIDAGVAAATASENFAAGRSGGEGAGGDGASGRRRRKVDAVAGGESERGVKYGLSRMCSLTGERSGSGLGWGEGGGRVVWCCSTTDYWGGVGLIFGLFAGSVRCRAVGVVESRDVKERHRIYVCGEAGGRQLRWVGSSTSS